MRSYKGKLISVNCEPKNEEKKTVVAHQFESRIKERRLVMVMPLGLFVHGCHGFNQRRI